jgi:hypothetical protein
MGGDNLLARRESPHHLIETPQSKTSGVKLKPASRETLYESLSCHVNLSHKREPVRGNVR